MTTLVETDSCVICMNSLQEKTILKSCNHAFCHECICKWSQNKRSCPLCNTSFTTLVIVDSNREEEAPIPSVKVREADIRSDLEALGNSYFVEEISRLLRIAQTFQRNLAKTRKQKVHFHTRFGSVAVDAWEERNWSILEDSVSKLEYYKDLIHKDESFEPYHLLQDLYHIQEQLESTRKNPTSEQFCEESSLKTVYSADDVDQLSSDEEDDYDFGLEDMKAKKKKPKVNKSKSKIKPPMKERL